MKKILLVEDDPFLIDIYTTKLKQEGYEMVLAKNGEQALKLSKSEEPDLILLDIVLPQMDGWHVLKEVKKVEGKSHPKVILLSNLSQKEEVEKGIALGADKYLIKSDFTPSQVIEEIKKLWI